MITWTSFPASVYAFAMIRTSYSGWNLPPEFSFPASLSYMISGAKSNTTLDNTYVLPNGVCMNMESQT